MAIIQVGGQREAADAAVGIGQLATVEAQLTSRGLEGPGHVQAALSATGKIGPELSQAAQVQLELTLQTLVEGALPLNPVVTQANVEFGYLPLLASALGLGSQHGRLVAQSTLEVQIGIQLQATILESARAAQRTAQAAGQLGYPEGRIEAAQVQGHLPADAVGEAQIDLALCPPLAGLEIQGRQIELGGVATEGGGQGKGAGRARGGGLEIAQVGAISIGHFALQALQAHRWLRHGI